MGSLPLYHLGSLLPTLVQAFIIRLKHLKLLFLEVKNSQISSFVITQSNILELFEGFYRFGLCHQPAFPLLPNYLFTLQGQVIHFINKYLLDMSSVAGTMPDADIVAGLSHT